MRLSMTCPNLRKALKVQKLNFVAFLFFPTITCCFLFFNLLIAQFNDMAHCMHLCISVCFFVIVTEVIQPEFFIVDAINLKKNVK